MSSGKLVTLIQMPSGQSGKVREIQGGHGIVNRLGALGIRHGSKITKISSMLMQGPVTIQSGHTQVAIGFGMAKRIIVEL